MKLRNHMSITSVCGARTLGLLDKHGVAVSSEQISPHTLKVGDRVDVYIDGARQFEAARIASIPYTRGGTLEPNKPIEVDMRTRFPLNGTGSKVVFVKSKD